MQDEDPASSPALDGGDAFLVIVSRREPWLFATLTRVFESNERVQVILDRRADPPAPTSLPIDRRQQDVSASLRALGWAVVIGRSEAPAAPAAPLRRDDAVVSSPA